MKDHLPRRKKADSFQRQSNRSLCPGISGAQDGIYKEGGEYTKY